MDRPVAREAANVGIVAALFAAGAAVGGSVGGAIGGVAGELLAGLVERGWVAARGRFLGDHGILEPDLQAAMRRAYGCAVDHLEHGWRQARGVEWRPGAGGDDRGASGLFDTLRLDASAALSDGGLRAATRDPVALEALGSRDLTRGALRGYLDDVLRWHDEGLDTFVRGGLEPAVAACFADELKANDRAWRAYQRLALAWLLNGIGQVRADQVLAAARQAEILASAERLEAALQRLEARPLDERDPSGEAVLDEIVAARDQILAELVERTARLEAVVVGEGDATRAAVAGVGERVDELGAELAEAAARRRAAAFERVEGFFRPFQDPARVFTHAFPLVGRDRQLALLTEFPASPQRVAILSAAGGVGKSRLLKEVLSRIGGTDGAPAVYMLADADAFESTMLDDLSGQTVLAVDDAHRQVGHLAGFLKAARRTSDQVRVVLAMRPHAVAEIRQLLLEARFTPEEVLEIQLPPLGRGALVALAREALGEDLAEQVVRIAGDSPLVTVVAARLLALHEIAPDRILDAEQAQAEIFGRFRDVLLGELGPDIDPAHAQAALELVAAIGPFRAYVDPLVERAAAFLGVPVDQLRRLVERLADAGALVQRGGELRVTPDLLSSYILKRAAVTNAGGSNGYTERVLAHFGDLATENLLGNLVDLLPREVLRFVRDILDRGPIEIPEPTLEAALSGVPTNPYEGLPPILRTLSSDPWLRGEAFDLLWRLGRDDRRAPNQNVDHPIRVLQDLGELRFGWDLAHYDALLDAVERWVGEPHAFAHRHSPLDVLDRLLEKDVSEFRAEGDRVVWREYRAVSTTFRDVRRRAIRVLAGLTRWDAPLVQYRALTSLLDALWSPDQLEAGRPVAGEVDARVRENDLIITAVRELLGRTDSRVLACAVEQRLRRMDRRTGGGSAGEPFRALLAVMPGDHAAKLARYLWLGWTQIHFFADEADYDRRAAAADEELRAVVAEVVAQEPAADRLKSRLERELGLITRYAVEPHPGYLLQTVAERHPGLALPLAELVVADPASPLAPYLPALLLPLRPADPAGFRRLVDAGIASSDPVVLAGVARVLCHVGWLDEADRSAVRRLAARPEPVVALGVLEALRRFPPEATAEVDEVTASVEIRSNPRLADALCEAYQPRAEAGMPRELWDALLEKLVPVLEVPEQGSATHDLVDLLVRSDPVRAVDFFVRRIRHSTSERDEGGDRYRPVPYARLSRFLSGQGNPDARRAALGRVAALMVEPDGLPRYWLAELFAIMAGGFDAVAVQVLDELLEEEGRYGIEQVQRLLEEAPGEFLFGHPEFVARLLEAARAAGADVLERLQDRLISVGARQQEMAVAGEPPRQFVGLRERATEAAALQPLESPLRALFERLADEAGDRMQAFLRNDDDPA
ncbi:MAG: hypothetical protein M3R02_15490 [Chloroflexota bacterium]|nr:hypothetical protein [Chloroflexota bacterium]